jgi:transposase-like protein
MAESQRDVTKEQHWREVLQRQVESGLTARAFCRLEELTESAFYFWRRTIRARDGQAPPRKSRRADGESPPPPAFVPAVVASPPRGEESILIELAGGRLLRLPSSTSPATLVDLIVCLEAARSVP